MAWTRYKAWVLDNGHWHQVCDIFSACKAEVIAHLRKTEWGRGGLKGSRFLDGDKFANQVKVRVVN